MNILTVGELVTLFQAYNTTLNKADGTIEAYRIHLKKFVVWAGADTPAANLSTLVIDQYCSYLVNLELAKSTVNTYLRALKVMCRWAARRKYIPEVPEFEMVRRDPPRPKSIFREGDLEKLLEATEKECNLLFQLRAVAILVTLFTTGLRVSELASLKLADIEHIEVDNQPAHIIKVMGAKRGGLRSVPLPHSAWQAIEVYHAELTRGTRFKAEWVFCIENGGPLARRGVQWCLRRLQEVSGVAVHAHKFRRNYAASFLNNSECDGRAMDILMDICGWQDLPTLKAHYAQYNYKTLVRAARVNAPTFAGVSS